MIKILPLLMILTIVSAAIISSCRHNVPVTEEQRLELIEEIKAFERELGFLET